MNILAVSKFNDNSHVSMNLYVLPLVSVLLASIANSKTIPNFAVADLVLGHSDFVTGTSPLRSASTLDDPEGVAFDPITRKVFVSDRSNDRVLRYSSITALNNGASAEAIFGQPQFSTIDAVIGPQSLESPAGIFFDRKGRLWVADSSDDRVLMYEAAAYRESFAYADKVLGQPDFTTNSTSFTSATKMSAPLGVCVDGSDRLWVADFNNNRILRFDSVSTKPNGAAADGVLGQIDFVTRTSGIGPAQLFSASGIAISAGGELFVTCSFSHRVVRFDDAATLPNGASATVILGQPSFATSTLGLTASQFNNPRGVTIAPDDSLWVADSENNRMLCFENASTILSGASATGILGAPDFTTAASLVESSQSLDDPRGSFVDTAGSLWVADNDNDRVLRFPADVTLPLVAITGAVPKTTTRAKLVIRGTASDAYGIQRVQYKVNNGPVKIATGTTTWQFRAPLAPGRNTITIQSVDSVGNVSAKKIIRIRRN